MSNGEQVHKDIRLGIQYHRPPTPPPEEWESDLAHISRLGLDHIYIWLLWPYVERSRGHYHWDELDQLVDMAGTSKLDVILNVELWALPTWAEKDEYRVVGLNGQPRPFSASIIHSLYGGRPCLDNRELRSLVEPFIRSAVERFKTKANLLCWKVWNEPDVDNCVCPDTLAKYRTWVAARFGSIDALSAFLGRGYNRWEDVRPPIEPGDTPANLLHSTFRMWSARETASWACGIVREADPTHPILTDTRSRSTARLDLLGERVFDDWSLADVPDIYGGHLHSTLFEPAHESPLEFVKPVMDLECKRSATQKSGRGFWITEVPGGAARMGGLLRPLHAGEMRFNLWTAIAHGARSVSPWQFKPERIGPEAPGWGVVEIDGTPTSRTQELGEFVQVVRSHRDLLLDSRPPAAEHAVLYSPESSVAAASLAMGKIAYGDAFHGIVAALWGESVHFDIIRSTDGLERYRSLYVPMPWLIPSENLENLLGYAEGGGTLCVEAGFASLADNGWYAAGAPGKGLRETLGYREGEVSPTEHAPITTAMGTLVGTGQRRAVHLEGAEVVGRYADGSPAVLKRVVGSGAFIYVAGYPSLYHHEQLDRGAAQTLMRLCGMRPIALVDAQSPVTCRLLESGQERILFVFNHSRFRAHAVVNPTFAYETWAPLSCGGKSEVAQAESPAFSITLEEKGVVILRLSSRVDRPRTPPKS